MTTYDRDWLCALHDARSWEPLFFWGHRQKRLGAPDASCLSQWFPAPFTVDGTRYPTAEHWMMAEKARLFCDSRALDEILAAIEPGAAKAIGRRVQGFDGPRWDAAARGIVTTGNLHKFRQHPLEVRDVLRG